MTDEVLIILKPDDTVTFTETIDQVVTVGSQVESVVISEATGDVVVVQEAGAQGPKGDAGSSGAAAALVLNETPSGLVNSVNATFTTAFSFIPESVEVFINGYKLTPVTDYTTFGNNQIHLMTSPLSGEFVLVNYIKQT